MLLRVVDGDARLRQDVLDLFWDVTRSLGQLMHDASAQHGLTPMQSIALLRVGSDSVSAGDLARHLGCDPSNVTGLVDQLERRGLVVRTTPAQDRRVRAVEATARGRDVATAVRAAMLDNADILDRLDAEDLETMSRLLRRMIGA